MIKIEHLEVWGFEHAIRGMRNPMNSWDKSDSCDCDLYNVCERCPSSSDYIDNCVECLVVGNNDMKLMKRLYKAGTEHRKYSRQIFVSMDITSNHVFWAEFDTYKINVTRNSCSKMHKIHVKSFEKDDFSHEGIDEVGGSTVEMFNQYIAHLEVLRVLFNETQERKYWRAMLEMLPLGYNLKATVTMTYENVFNIVRQRDGHKWMEWNTLVHALRGLPYVEEIINDKEINISKNQEN